MSMLYMVKAMHCKVGNPIRKLVLIKMADNANDNGQCWPSYQYIADVCEVSKRSVISHVEFLCEMGLLKKSARKGVKGNSSNIYTLNIPAGAINSIGGANDSLPSAADSPTPSAGDSPRISHSFETVSETGEHKDSQANRCEYDWDFVLQSWNQFAEANSLSSMRMMGDKRKATIKKSFQLTNKLRKEVGKQPMEFHDFVERYLGLASQAITPFHKGQERGSDWKADFNYIFAKDVAESLITQGELKR